MRNDQLDNRSIDYINGTYDLIAETLAELQTYDRAALTPDQQVSYDVYAWWLNKELQRRAYMYHEYPVHQFLNSYQSLMFLLFTEIHPLDTRADAEDYLARLSQLDTQIGQVLDGLKIRAEMGIILPDFMIDLTIQSMRNDLGMASSNPSSIRISNITLYTRFHNRLSEIEGLSRDDKKLMRETAKQEIEQGFIPAYLEMIDYLITLKPSATDDAGLWRLPDGNGFYAYTLYDMTSTTLSAQEIHDLGLREVERVRAEMLDVFAELGYATDAEFGSLLSRAINDGGFIRGEKQTLQAYEDLIALVEANYDGWFDVQPAAALTIIPEPAGGGGYYVAGSIDGTRPGSFHAGIGGQTALFMMPSLTFHEGVPGHHFQIALAREMNLPLFRNAIIFNGYVEGWALYAERLAWEMGLYADNPYGNIGRLYYELLRAVCLVTDTGIHELGWTREEARAYIRDAFGGNYWVHEVERYIALPGQATGYMVGMLTILDLRARAQAALGDQFDIVAFHNVILSNGSVPLELLETIVDDWIAAQLTA